VTLKVEYIGIMGVAVNVTHSCWAYVMGGGGVPHRKPHCLSGLATCPLWEPSPSHPILL